MLKVRFNFAVMPKRIKQHPTARTDCTFRTSEKPFLPATKMQGNPKRLERGESSSFLLVFLVILSKIQQRKRLLD